MATPFRLEVAGDFRRGRFGAGALEQARMPSRKRARWPPNGRWSTSSRAGRLTLGIMTAVGGFVDISELVFAPRPARRSAMR
jgi:hypothetical protein